MITIKEEKIAEMMFDIWNESDKLKNTVMVGEYIANKLKQAINYTHCCTVENEQLRFLIDKFQTPKGNYLIELLMAEKERKNKKP